MSAVIPQVELPPYSVVDPRISNRLSRERDWDFVNKTGAFKQNGFHHHNASPEIILSYHFHWQPYYLMKVTKCLHF
jgi:hypothetical protein